MGSAACAGRPTSARGIAANRVVRSNHANGGHATKHSGSRRRNANATGEERTPTKRAQRIDGPTTACWKLSSRRCSPRRRIVARSAVSPVRTAWTIAMRRDASVACCVVAATRGSDSFATSQPSSVRRRVTWRRAARRDGNGAWTRSRTADTGIFNPLLYQLSYPGEARCTIVNAAPFVKRDLRGGSSEATFGLIRCITNRRTEPTRAAPASRRRAGPCPA